MRLFGKRKKENVPNDKSKFGYVLNYIKIDAINNKPLESFYWEYGKKKKGTFAKKTEIIYLEEGEHEIAAHGVTYQTKTEVIKVFVETGKNYVLGAGVFDDNTEGLFFEER
jgi:hypothetical protein